MALRWFAAAFLLALLVPLLEGSFSGVSLARGSLAALALLPWLALAALPRASLTRVPLTRERPGARRALREALFAGALALPPLALGAGLDLARGVEPRALAAVCAGGWLVLVLWVAAAAHATSTARARTGFALLWLALVPGAAALRLALAWVPLGASWDAPGRTPLFALDPLVWCHRWGRAGGLEVLAVGELALAVGAALLALLCVLALARPAHPEPGP